MRRASKSSERHAALGPDFRRDNKFYRINKKVRMVTTITYFLSN
jgi:hypothetical protein